MTVAARLALDDTPRLSDCALALRAPRNVLADVGFDEVSTRAKIAATDVERGDELPHRRLRRGPRCRF
jgi:hypothetical protein